MSHQGWMDDDQFAEDLRIHQEAATNVLDDDFNMQAHTLTLAKAKEEAKALVAELFGSWLQLRHIINQHGTIVQKRWSKKTTEQRKRLLLGVWPQMSESHRPDISFLARCDLSEKGEALADRDAIYFPHINLKDLATSRNFLLFLDSRTRLTPDTFANADMNSLRVGIKCRAIRPGYLGGYTMHLTGQKTPETYGRISSWKEDPESSYKLVSGMGAQPGDGLVILEVQRRIIIFLLACSRSILHDLPSKVRTFRSEPLLLTSKLGPKSMFWEQKAPLLSELFCKSSETLCSGSERIFLLSRLVSSLGFLPTESAANSKMCVESCAASQPNRLHLYHPAQGST